MNILIKKSPKENRPINKWMIVFVVILAITIILGYLVSVSVSNVKTQQQITTLNFECVAYGQELTSAASSNLNTSACQNQNSTQLPSCGAVFYCYYSSSACEKADQTQGNLLSCVCDALRSNEVVAANQGICQEIN